MCAVCSPPPLALLAVSVPDSPPPGSWDTVAVSTAGGELVLFDAEGERVSSVDPGTGEDFPKGVNAGPLWMSMSSPDSVVNLVTGERRDVPVEEGMRPRVQATSATPMLTVANPMGADVVVVTAEHLLRLGRLRG